MKCPKCSKDISFWEWFKFEYRCESCFNNPKKKRKKQLVVDTKKKELELEKEREILKGQFKYGLIMLGIILILMTYYVGFVSDSGYYNNVTQQKYTVQEAKAICDNPLSGLFDIQTPNICRQVRRTFFISVGVMALGIILFIAGILQNLVIYNYNLNK